MKKNIIFLFAMVALLLTGCTKKETLICESKEQELTEGTIQSKVTVVFENKKAVDVTNVIMLNYSESMRTSLKEKYPGVSVVKDTINDYLKELSEKYNIEQEIEETDEGLIITIHHNDLAIIDDVDREVKNVKELRTILENAEYTCE